MIRFFLFLHIISMLVQQQIAERIGFYGHLSSDGQEQLTEKINAIIFTPVETRGSTYTGGTLTINQPGTYLYSCTLIVQSDSDQIIQLQLNLNDEKTSSFKSSLYVSAGDSTISNTGVIQVISQNVIRIYLKIKSSIKLLQNSHFMLHLLSSKGTQQAFTVQTTPDVWHYQMNHLKVVSFQVWSSQESKGCFSTTNLLVPANGFLVAESNGLFMISLNILIESEEDIECSNWVYLKTNENKIACVHLEVSQPKQTLTINILKFLKLSMNDRFWIEMASSCNNVRVHHGSSFSGSQIQQPVQGLSLATSEHISRQNINGWFAPDLTIFRKPYSYDYNDNHIEMSAKHITIKTSGYAILAVDLYVNKPSDNSGEVILAVTRNQDTIDTVTHLKESSWVKKSKIKGTQFNLHLISRMLVDSGDTVRIQIFFPGQGRWILLKNSSLAIQVLEATSSTMLQKSSTVVLISKKWSILHHCLSLDQLNVKILYDSSMKVRKNGIYNVEFVFKLSESKESIDLEIGLLHDEPLLYSKENSIRSGNTLKLSSTVRLNADMLFGFYIKGNKESPVKGVCRVKLTYLGDHHSIIGFQANLQKNFITQGNTGYFRINKYDKPNSDLYYNTYEGFDHDRGIFKAPFRGIYLVSINVVILKVIMNSKQNYVAVMLKVNDKETIFFDLKEHKFLSKDEQNPRNSTISFCMSGALHLNDHDTVHIEVYVNNDVQWEIDSRSSFSMVMLTSQNNGFSAYRPSIKLKNTDQMNQKIVSGWELGHPASPYAMFKGTTKSAPKLDGGDNIKFAVSGNYLISVQILMQYQEPQKELTLKLVESSSQKKKTIEFECDTYTMNFNVMSISCQFFGNFDKDEIYTVQISTGVRSFIGVYNFYNNKQNNDENMAYLSVVLLGNVVDYQAGLLYLQEFSGGVSTIETWQYPNLLNTPGNYGFDTTNGVLNVIAKGWFLFTATVFCRRTFGNGTIDLVRRGDAAGNVLLRAKGECHKHQRSLSFIGVQHLDRNEQISLQQSGYGGGDIVAKETHWSFSYLKWNCKRYYVNSRIDYHTRAQKKYDQPITWSESKTDKVAVSKIPLESKGVYFITINLIITTASDFQVQLMVVYKDECTSKQSSKTQSPALRTHTVALACAIVIRQSNPWITINLQGNGNIQIESESTASVSFITKNHLEHPLLILRMNAPMNYHSWGTKNIRKYSIQSMSTFFFNNLQTAITIYGGTYLISCHMVITVEKPREMTLGVLVNQELAISTKEYVSDTKTVSIKQIAYLRQGATLSLVLYPGSHVIEKGSTWNILLLDAPNGGDSESMLPVISQDLTHGNKILVNADQELSCDAVAPRSITYQWFFNNKILSNEVFETLHPSKYMELGSGRYQCQALSERFFSVGPVSRAAYIKISPVNECEKQPGICGEEATCHDKQVGFECRCENQKYEHVKGKGCVAVAAKKDDKSIKPGRSLVILILIPFVCLTILIVIACTIYVCMKRRQIHRRDPERQAVVGAENSDDITMQSLNNSLAEDYSDIENERTSLSSGATQNTNSENGGVHFLTVPTSSQQQPRRTRFNTHPRFLGGSRDSRLDEESSPRPDLNWRKFSNGSVQVIYRK
ncbi:uncharacterized protein [Clytia hemisphaerica]|uniref:uncharacterized protein isoform X2 n=1 Tax=Clytia hemisphaerica TaxID=252671 RepID=UPI0034D3B7BC